MHITYLVAVPQHCKMAGTLGAMTGCYPNWHISLGNPTIESKTVTILELTVPWNSTSSLDNVRSRKENKPNYQLLTSDLSAQGYSALFLTIEIGCLGNHTNDAYTRLKAIAPKSTAAQRRRILLEASKAAITGSYYIFAARNLTTWQQS